MKAQVARAVLRALAALAARAAREVKVCPAQPLAMGAEAEATAAVAAQAAAAAEVCPAKRNPTALRMTLAQHGRAPMQCAFQRTNRWVRPQAEQWTAIAKRLCVMAPDKPT